MYSGTLEWPRRRYVEGFIWAGGTLVYESALIGSLCGLAPIDSQVEEVGGD